MHSITASRTLTHSLRRLQSPLAAARCLKTSPAGRVTVRQLTITRPRLEKCCASKKKQETAAPPTTSVGFWSSRPTWHRASLNTLRCLVGCTTGDFSAMWLLQSYYPELGMPTIMGISSEFVTNYRPCAMIL